MAERDPRPLLRRLRINPPGRDSGMVNEYQANTTARKVRDNWHTKPNRAIVAVTPQADVGPLLAGLARVRYGCLDGVPDGLQAPAYNLHRRYPPLAA